MKRRLVIGLLFGAVLLALAMWGVPLAELGDAFDRLDWTVLVPLAVIFMAQQLLRSWRQLVLVRAVQPSATFMKQFAILCMAFFCINTFPARIGEVVRPYLLLEQEDVPLGAGFGVIIVERVVDLASALLMVWGVAVFVDIPPVPLEVFDTRIEVIELARRVATGLLPPLIGVLLALVFFQEAALRALAWGERLAERLLPFDVVRRLGRLGLGFAEHFVAGLVAVRQPGRLVGVVLLTAATWGMTGALYVVLAQAMGIGDTIGYGEGIAILAITMLAIAIPSPPGQAGVYEASVRAALALFGVVGGDLDGVALAYALVVHWWIYLVQSASAAWFFARSNLQPGRLVREARERWAASAL